MIIAIVIAAVLLLLSVVLYNGLVRRKNDVENACFLTLLTDIVEDLNLNTRIWTKA